MWFRDCFVFVKRGRLAVKVPVSCPRISGINANAVFIPYNFRIKGLVMHGLITIA